MGLYPEAKVIPLNELGVGKAPKFRRYSPGLIIEMSSMDGIVAQECRTNVLILHNLSGHNKLMHLHQQLVGLSWSEWKANSVQMLNRLDMGAARRPSRLSEF